MTDAQALASGRNVLVGTRKMKAIGRAREMGETSGFMKFLVDADTDEILGGAIFGINGDEAIHTSSTSCTPKPPTPPSAGQSTFTPPSPNSSPPRCRASTHSPTSQRVQAHDEPAGLVQVPWINRHDF
ncbi:MAG: hypothetical protein M3431_06225 [Actinomycetota bacterium]|nr:hypothetical protein [Actinomycetota bacterium]